MFGFVRVPALEIYLGNSSGLGKLLSKVGMTDFVTGKLTKGGMAALIGGGVTSIPLIASLLGIDGAQKKARDLIDEARESVSIYGQ